MANNGWKNSSWCKLRIVIIDFIHRNGKTNDKQSDMKRGHGFKSLVPALSVIVMVEKKKQKHFFCMERLHLRTITHFCN